MVHLECLHRRIEFARLSPCQQSYSACKFHDVVIIGIPTSALCLSAGHEALRYGGCCGAKSFVDKISMTADRLECHSLDGLCSVDFAVEVTQYTPTISRYLLSRAQSRFFHSSSLWMIVAIMGTIRRRQALEREGHYSFQWVWGPDQHRGEIG